MNHTAEECYSKHGYPPWYKNRNEHVSNNIVVGSDIDCKGNKSERHTRYQQYSKENQEDVCWRNPRRQHRKDLTRMRTEPKPI